MSSTGTSSANSRAFETADHVQRLDAEIERLERSVADTDSPIDRMLLAATRHTRARTQASARVLGWIAGHPVADPD